MRLDEREQVLIWMTVKLVEEFSLTVDEVMEHTNYPRDKCYMLMEALVSSNVAEWRSPVLGIIERNVFFTMKEG